MLSCRFAGSTGDVIFGHPLFNFYEQKFPFYFCLFFAKFSSAISEWGISRTAAPTGEDQ